MRTGLHLVLLVAALSGLLPCTIWGIPGDVDSSGRVDGLDLATVSRLVGTVRGDPRYAEAADFDGDGRIGPQDLAIVRANFARLARDEAVWVADARGNRLVKLSLASGRQLLAVPAIASPSAVAVDTARGSVWALAAGGTALVHVSPAGSIRALVRGFGEAVSLAVDPADGTCWVADRSPMRVVAVAATVPNEYDVAAGSGSHRVVRGFESFVDAGFGFGTGRFLPGSLSIDGRRRSLWIAYGGLVRLSTSVPATYNITTNSGSHVFQFGRADIAVADPVRGTCFAARFSDSGLLEAEPAYSVPATRVATVSGINMLALNPVDGTLWAGTGRGAGTTELVRLDTDRVPAVRTAVTSIASIAIDGASGSVWLANPRAGTVSRYSPGGLLQLENASTGSPASLALLAGDQSPGAPAPRAVVTPARAAVGEAVRFSVTLPVPIPGARFQWDFDGDGTFDFSSSSTAATTRAYQKAGIYAPILRVTAPSGLMGSDYSSLVRVGSLSLKLTATPAQGPAPLAVRFRAEIDNPQALPVSSLAWDFDGDGVLEAYQVPSGGSSEISHTYPASGTFTTIARVTGSDDRSSASALEVRALPGPPRVQLAIFGGFGLTAPQPLGYRADVTPGEAPIAAYRWDRENDGVIDLVTTDRNQVSFNVAQSAIVGRVVVVDSRGAEAVATAEFAFFRNARPGGFLVATPDGGNAPLAVDFSGQALDPDGRIVRYDYRFENPSGPIDSTSTTTMAARHVFETPGTYDVALTLTDDGQERDCTFCPARPGATVLTRRVRVNPAGAPSAALSASLGKGTAPLSLTLSAAGSSPGVARYRWFFDKGILSDDFESGAPGWTATALWRLDGVDPNSGARSWVLTEESDFNATGFARLLSPAFDVPAAPTRTQLQFFHKFESFSAVQVEITTDGGSTFEILRPLPGGISEPTGYDPVSIALSAYAGRRARVAFTAERPVRVRWKVDDVRIVVDPPSAAPPDLDSPTASSAQVTYPIPGVYRPLLRVTDSQGRSDEATLQVQVLQRRPNTRGNFTLDASLEVFSLPFECGDGGCFEVFYRAPAPVAFKPIVGAPFGAALPTIAFFEWDFDNDGKTDATTTTPEKVRTTYERPGRFSCRVRATDVDGRTVSTVLRFPVNVAGPIPRSRVEADVAGGPAPLLVTFTPSIESTRPLTSFSWDFNSDGVPEFSGRGTPVTTTFRYRDPGQYTTCLTVYDDLGTASTFGNTCLTLLVTDPATVVRLSASPLTGTPPVSVTFTPDLSGTVLSGTPRFEYDFDGDGIPNLAVPGPEPQTFEYTHGGRPRVLLKVFDNFGLRGQAQVRLSFGTPPVSLPSAFPLSGPAPLDVTFAPFGTDADGSIVEYDFDFEGIGLFGSESSRSTEALYGISRTSVPKPVHHVYHRPGVYDARMLVRDNDGFTHVQSLRITVTEASAAALGAAPPSGIVPFSTRLSAGLTIPGTATRFEFDRDGDGTFELTTGAATIDARYETPGVFRPAVRITTATGQKPIASATVRAGREGEPAASVSAEPASGVAALTVQLTGLPAPESGPIVMHEWDFEGDGRFDFVSLVTGRTSHTYGEPGVYTPTYRVTTSSGRAAVAQTRVEARPGISVTRSPESFDPSANQSVAIRTSLVSPAAISIRIIDRARRPVRTLVNRAPRARGLHEDVWNGRNDAGQIVSPGVYLYLVDVSAGGSSFTLDLTQDPPPAIRRITPDYELSFDVAADNELVARYTLQRPAEVTCYVVPFVGFNPMTSNSQQIARTLLNREPQPTGRYVLPWDGLLDDGQLAPDLLPTSGERIGYLIPLFASDLPDNSIIVTGKLALSELSKDPDMFSPGNPYATRDDVTIRFTLSKAAIVGAQVRTNLGVLVKSLAPQSLSRGQGSVVWDGTDSDGMLVPPGDYRVVLEAREALDKPPVRQAIAIEVLY